MKIIVSTTGYAQGRGSDRYRWVAGLSDREREAVKNETALVVVPREGIDHYGDVYVVTYYNGYWNHRLPTIKESESIEDALINYDFVRTYVRGKHVLTFKEG